MIVPDGMTIDVDVRKFNPGDTLPDDIALAHKDQIDAQLAKLAQVKADADKADKPAKAAKPTPEAGT